MSNPSRTPQMAKKSRDENLPTEGLKEAVARIVDPVPFHYRGLERDGFHITSRLHEACDDDIQRALSKAEAILSLIGSTPLSTGLDAEGWRPIETAPRDGTQVDVWCTPPRKAFIAGGDGRVPNAWFAYGGWRVHDSFADDGWTTVYNVTHWLPLPAAPATVLGGGGRDISSVADIALSLHGDSTEAEGR